ncbi:SDR family oxidoreductase [Aerobium aerolatum]|uniref:NAD(P)-dependent dehydrogenase, short-chain alcohol dehydrogenase family n=1 Tax=Aquamicrobium aerolatum DSM 21857 TaxID=1121003 RepID=A0A1I3SZE5_9HYPH|nr:SDR family oxidoreductase [Aquamicrobium aerolatum]SFJ64238.1 NAD(P)-dependent dehydrogenase, short-chain alcohol dehydrogenase family [Aquamicrobium aerolatum DSM 21857]
MAREKIALVTGAGSGIGKSVATALVRNGWHTIIVGRTLSKLADAAAAARAQADNGATALPLACDVSNEEQVEALFDQIGEQFGRLDLLFNNAGAGYPATLIDELPVDVWRDIVDVNLTGSFLCARAAFGMMRRQTPMGGRIINNGSISAHAPRPGSVAYTSTKHAITGLTKTLALDGRAFDIACGQIDIGNAMTEMAVPMTQGVPQPDGSIRAEAVMDVEHVADAVLHMANLPLETNVLFMTVMATKMPFVGRG